MRWMLAGCCGLALISLSVALEISQKPRFYGVKTNRDVFVYCLSTKQSQPSKVDWYKADEYDDARRTAIQEAEKIHFKDQGMIQNAFLVLRQLQTEDSGVYFCRINDTWGPGTQLQVIRPSQRLQAVYRSQMKDSLMVLQGLMLAVCIATLVLRRRTLVRNTTNKLPELYQTMLMSLGHNLYRRRSADRRNDCVKNK